MEEERVYSGKQGGIEEKVFSHARALKYRTTNFLPPRTSEVGFASPTGFVSDFTRRVSPNIFEDQLIF